MKIPYWPLLLAVTCPSMPVGAQSVIHTWPVAGVPVGDVDGDGVQDRVEYQWLWYTVFRLHSGRTGLLLAQHVPALPNVGAVPLDEVGDVDGDGRDDFAFHVRRTNSSYEVRIVSPFWGRTCTSFPFRIPMVTSCDSATSTRM